VSTRIERIRFYDGEYLRAFDFEAEQGYHRLMRQRLNQELHLCGIVEGLQIEADKDSVPGATQYNITTGMAIDHYGREIVVDQAFVLRGSVLSTKNLKAGKNAVVIFYKQTASSLPSAGYALCNDPSQNTRWLESFDVVLIPDPPAKFTGEMLHPDTGEYGLLLGTVTLVANLNGFSITTPITRERLYIGLRAGRIQHPQPTTTYAIDPLAKKSDPTDPAPEGTLDVNPAIFAERDIQTRQNVLIGDDFDVAAADQVTKFPAPFPPTGNVKVSNNLILRGDLFASSNGKWYGLKDYIKTLIPEFMTGNFTIEPKANNPNPSNDTVVLSKTSNLKSVSSAQVMVSLAGVELIPKNQLWPNWWDKINNDPITTQVSAVAVKKAGTENQFDIKVSWTVGPRTTPVNISDSVLDVKSLQVSYLIIFYP
jgi:hypothetical protein